MHIPSCLSRHAKGGFHCLSRGMWSRLVPESGCTVMDASTDAFMVDYEPNSSICGSIGRAAGPGLDTGEPLAGESEQPMETEVGEPPVAHEEGTAPPRTSEAPTLQVVLDA